MENPNVDFILVDKLNLDPKNRDDLKTIGVTNPIYIEYFHPDGLDALKDLCTERIISRKGVRPFESNTMLSKDGNSNITLDTPVSMSGVYKSG